MLKPALIAAAVVVASSVHAQDIVGLEDCSKARDTDKKIGCLQSNVAFLHALIRKNDAAAQAKLKETSAALTAANTRLDDVRVEVDRLKQALADLAKKAPAK